ncbi:hypothetical protein BpHYR1_052376 [Brachionus plicatilis]|uniref:RNA-directed DNA polymerase from mobile element jockey-like n=1 Tax=Brachionus plicatilis TaxID=10195 RepID=A0A3M7QRW1_BRAPC|nr:hypothetical protein BpHYR1_052376 [Brachionus plicatilis]
MIDYCDGIVKYKQRNLDKCSKFAQKWKIDCSDFLSKWQVYDQDKFIFDTNKVVASKFLAFNLNLYGFEILQAQNVEYLGLPIGDKRWKKVETEYKILYMLMVWWFLLAKKGYNNGATCCQVLKAYFSGKSKKTFYL